MKYLPWKKIFLLLLCLTHFMVCFVPSPIVALRNSKVDAVETQIGVISTGLDSFQLEMERYPDTYEGLSILYEKPKAMSLDVWKGPYILKKYLLKDPWRQDFRYFSPGGHNKKSFDLFSIGRDGVEGSIDDINNWDESRAWREHYQKFKFWYWSDLLKSWYWYDLWEKSWKLRISLFISVVFVSFGVVLWTLMRLTIKMVKKLLK